MSIICEDCQISCPRTGPMQKYCVTCSEARDLVRKRLWARAHSPSEQQKTRNKENSDHRKTRNRENGLERNRLCAMSIDWDGSSGPDLKWFVRIAVPFSYAASKNHIYAMRAKGHVALRKESDDLKSRIASEIFAATGDARIVHNKVWLDILVQKSNHKGDAVNVVDLVCDGVRRGIPVDDRWFCIRRLDWQIVKESPRLFIGIGQEDCEDSQVCSYCGQIKPLRFFNVSKDKHLGIGRECKECRGTHGG